MIKVLRFIWELPQNIVGFLLSRGSTSEQVKLNDKVVVKVYYKDLHKKSKGEAVTLGEFIILDTIYKDNKYKTACTKTTKHEFGHVLQSRMLGPLYLIVIGLFSFVHACFFKGNGEDYYKFFTESWANKLSAKYLDK